jgi:hypothetical protein
MEWTKQNAFIVDYVSHQFDHQNVDFHQSTQQLNNSTTQQLNFLMSNMGFWSGRYYRLSQNTIVRDRLASQKLILPIGVTVIPGGRLRPFVGSNWPARAKFWWKQEVDNVDTRMSSP